MAKCSTSTARAARVLAESRLIPFEAQGPQPAPEGFDTVDLKEAKALLEELAV
jgi:hypothetical protein